MANGIKNPCYLKLQGFLIPLAVIFGNVQQSASLKVLLEVTFMSLTCTFQQIIVMAYQLFFCYLKQFFYISDV